LGSPSIYQFSQGVKKRLSNALGEMEMTR